MQEKQHVASGATVSAKFLSSASANDKSEYD